VPDLPFQGFPGSAHYRVVHDRYVLRYRLPEQDAFHQKASPFRVSRSEKRPFFEWARKFLFGGGRVPDDFVVTEQADARELAKADQTMSLGEAIRGYLAACAAGNRWMKPRAAETVTTQTQPVLGKLEARLGADTPLVAISGEQVAAFVRALGGKKETKERHLCPVSSLFTWAIREGHIRGPNPAQGVVFWREAGEEPHDGLRKSYTDDEVARLIAAAQTDSLALDAIYLCRYLALRPQDAALLRWEDWKWDQLLVAVRRSKTRESGVEVSHVDLHPVLAERYRHRRGATGYCLEYARKRTKIVWPPTDELRRRVEATSCLAVARELGVSNVAVKKRLERPSGRVDRITTRAVTDLDQRRLIAKSITQRVSDLTRAAGLYEEGIQPLYVLRHTFASDSLRRGTPPAIVAREMGISVLTLEKYYWHAIPRGELDGRTTNRWGLVAEAAPAPVRAAAARTP
jgi:integrase